MTDAGKDAEKQEPSSAVGGNAEWCSHSGKQYGGSSKNLRWNYPMIQKLHFWAFIQRKRDNRYLGKASAPPYLLHYLQHPRHRNNPIRNGQNIHTYTYTHIYTYITDYYSAIKKNEILPFATTSIELEDVMLSEINQSEKDKYHMMSLMCGFKKQNKQRGERETNNNKK